MAKIEWLKEEYKTKIRENEYLGIGGENCFPFQGFEGNIPHSPKIGLEIYDSPGEDWPEAVKEPYLEVWKDPVMWAKEVERKYQPDILCLQLESTNPMGQDASPEKAGETAKAIASATTLPLIIYGCGNAEKDANVLKRVAEVLPKKVVLGPVQEGNYNILGASCLAYGHYIIAQTPTDVNLCKQLNILLSNLGLSLDKIIIDPTPSSLGYGLEYTYSAMEKIRSACFQTNDDKLNLPMIGNIGKEVWKIKEVKIDDEKMGETKTRGIFFEAITAISFILAGADVVVVRHPKTLALLRGWLGKMQESRESEAKIEKLKVKSEKLEAGSLESGDRRQGKGEPFDVIIQSAFAVFRELGGGLADGAYKNALFLELEQHSLEAKKDLPLPKPLVYKEQEIGGLSGDIICGNILIMIGCQDSKSLNQYLLCSGLSYGIGLSFTETLNIVYK
ncbi:MAG: acetyl-CoA decarbonylase/synthase complex subunit delta [bacterium]|nr:acetyl-CoA decarbonylase/synthase complex subunit delta [bacterium]